MNKIDKIKISPEEPVSDGLEEAAIRLAKEYVDARRDCGLVDPICLGEIDTACYEGILFGAKWQKKQSIVDTCYHLEMRLPEILNYNGIKVKREDFINDFRKAIEG